MLHRKRRFAQLTLALAILLIAVASFTIPPSAAQEQLPEPQHVTLSSLIGGDQFGSAVALDGDTLIVGAENTYVDDIEQHGIAYIFARDQANPETFNLVTSITGSDTAAFDHFGVAVAIDGDTAVVGSQFADVNGSVNQGAAYVFERNQGGVDQWGEVAKLTMSPGRVLANFGVAIAIHEDQIAVGAPVADGSVYLFKRDAGGPNQWGQVQELRNDHSDASDSFGDALLLDEQGLLVGAPLADMLASDVPSGDRPPAHNNAGAVFVYEHDGTEWQLQKRIFPSDADPFDRGSFNTRFGSAVARSGDYIIAGATSSEIAEIDVGRVFVYQRDKGGADQWGEVAILEPSDGEFFDRFGQTVVAVPEGFFVGSSRGINGAIYFFHHPDGLAPGGTIPPQSGAWTEAYTFSTTDNVLGSLFGAEMMANHNTLVVGAYGYDGLRGRVFLYPIDQLIAAAPTDTPTPTPEPTDTPTENFVFLPYVAGGTAPPSFTGNITNTGILSGLNGITLGPVGNPLDAPLTISMATTATPGAALPGGTVARGDHFTISAERNLALTMERPLVIGIPVPPEADTSHLALAYLSSVEDVYDTAADGSFWEILPGVYDETHKTFFTTLAHLAQDGTLFVLAEHPDFASPRNGSSARTSSSATVSTATPTFTALCYGFANAADCTPETEARMAEFLTTVHQRMTNEFGYPDKPRIINQSLEIVVAATYSLTQQSLNYATFIRPEYNPADPSTAACQDSLGFYNWTKGAFALCLPPGGTIGAAEEHSLVHEYFHATQHAYPTALLDAELKTKDSWITEGMAKASEASYFLDHVMHRKLTFDNTGSDFPLHTVDIALTFPLSATATAAEEIHAYRAQDFWVYLGQRFEEGLEYMGPVLEQGGLRTGDVARALEKIYGEPFADLYWGWVKNQVMEKEYALGSGLGNQCQLTADALTAGVSPDVWQYSPAVSWYPFVQPYHSVEPLTTAVVKIEFPQGREGAIVFLGYEDCDGVTDPAARTQCLIDAKAILHSKIYVENEANCEIDPVPDDLLIEAEGYRRLTNISHTQNYYVVVANGDQSRNHGFAIFIE